MRINFLELLAKQWHFNWLNTLQIYCVYFISDDIASNWWLGINPAFAGSRPDENSQIHYSSIFQGMLNEHQTSWQWFKATK